MIFLHTHFVRFHPLRGLCSLFVHARLSRPIHLGYRRTPRTSVSCGLRPPLSRESFGPGGRPSEARGTRGNGRIELQQIMGSLNMSERPEEFQAANQQQAEKEDGHNGMALDHDRSDNNPFAEDELVTWLQYPLDDNFGRGYCSDVFRHWPPPLTTKTTTTGAHQDTGTTYGGEGGGQASSSSSIGVHASSSGSPAGKSMGNAAGIAMEETKLLPRTKHVEEALAMGAGRAAGIVRQSGVEAFTRVRTSREPKLGSPSFGSAKACAAPAPPPRPLERSPSLPLGSSMLPPRLRTFGSYGNMLSSLPPSSPGRKSPSPSRLPAPALSSENQENKQCPKNPEGASSSDQSLLKSSTTALGSRNANANVHQPKADTLLGGLVRADSTAVASGSDVNDSGADRMGSDSLGRSRLSSASFGKKVDARDVQSGGSQTSESNKEAAPNGKRKFEDSECQSEDAEGESAETKNSQARTSTSKRTRAAETHNLSERRRRDRINEKMKALQDLIPNSNKTDKASVLDEAIEYLKMLQLQLQMMSMRSGVSLSPMVLPSGLPHMQIPQLEPFHPVGMGMTGGPSGAGAGMGQNIGIGMLDMTYGVPARPLISVPSLSAPANSAFRPQSASTLNSSISHFQALTTAESLPAYFPHSHLQIPSQSIPSVNMDMYNTYLQQQQQFQQLQQLHPHEHQQQQQEKDQGQQHQHQKLQQHQQQQQHGSHFQK